jgi:hypothetical protein
VTVLPDFASTGFCTQCGLLMSEHSESMLNVCRIFDISKPFSAGDDPAENDDAGDDEAPPPRPPSPASTISSTSVARVLTALLTDIRSELEDLGNDGPVGPLLPYYVNEGDRHEDILALYLAAKEVRNLLGDIVNDAAGALASVMESKSAVIGDYEVERTSGTTRRNWDRPGVARAVSVKACQQIPEVLGLDFDTNSVVGAVNHITKTFIKTFRLEPRTKALYDLGIKAELYSESVPGRPGIIVRPHRETA